MAASSSCPKNPHDRPKSRTHFFGRLARVRKNNRTVVSPASPSRLVRKIRTTARNPVRNPAPIPSPLRQPFSRTLTRVPFKTSARSPASPRQPIVTHFTSTTALMMLRAPRANVAAHRNEHNRHDSPMMAEGPRRTTLILEHNPHDSPDDENKTTPERTTLIETNTTLTTTLRTTLNRTTLVPAPTNPNTKKKIFAPTGNRTRVCTVAGYYSTTRPSVPLKLNLRPHSTRRRS